MCTIVEKSTLERDVEATGTSTHNVAMLDKFK